MPPLGEPAPPLPPAPRLRYRLALALAICTFLTTTTLGGAWTSSGGESGASWLSPATIQRVWSDPAALRGGLAFSIPLLVILLSHEFGHYWMCRRHRLAATLPYFLPAPWGLGTLGAFIRIRAPIREKRVLFDVGFAGPIAGFVALLPFLAIGIARSVPVEIVPTQVGEPQLILGGSWAMRLAMSAFHPGMSPEMGLELHPFAIAAWVGLLATSLNLLPFGQLDGGHILYAALGVWQRRLAWPLWIVLVAASVFWVGWAVWSVIVLVVGLRHPPVRDEEAPLGLKRTVLALLALLLLALSLMPVPVYLL